MVPQNVKHRPIKARSIERLSTHSSTKKHMLRFTVSTVLIALIGALLSSSAPTQVAYAAGQITGTVFRDANFDGTQQGNEPGVGNVTVKVYDSAGTEVGSGTSAIGTGSYSVAADVNSTGPYRVEFTGYPSYLQPGVATAGGGTTVQFVADGDSNGIDLALSYPLDYCQSTNPNLFTSCFVVGNQTSTSDVLVSFPYTSTGSAADSDYVKPNLEAVANQTGSIWGLAYQRASNTLFASAFQKRHVGYGSTDSTGTIYIVPNPQDGATTGVAPFLDVNTLLGANTAGTNPHPKSGVVPAIDFEEDFGAYEPVGKVSFGDMDISEDDRSLWAINLADRQLYQIPLGADPANPTAPTQASEITQFDLLATNSYASGDAPACPDNSIDLRPFAVKVHDGRVYVGMVCSGESTDSVDDLTAMAYAFDPNAATPLFEEVLNFDLDYERGCGSDNVNSPCNASANWLYWEPDPAAAGRLEPFQGELLYPQPMFTDIEFTLGGDMIVGLRDRFGDQMGYQLFDPVPANQGNRVEVDAPGDILIATPDGSGKWVPNTSLTPEFFGGDGFILNPYAHEETTLGGLALVPGSDEVVTTAFDPVRDYSGGIHVMDTQASSSTPVRSYEIFRTRDDPQGVQTFGKANGLGDLVAMCQAAPIEIGNRVWNDANGNGLQDPGEAGIESVDVELYKDGVLVGTTTTGTNGRYLFNDGNVDQNGANGIQPFMGTVGGSSGYEIRILSTQTELTGLSLTEAFDAVASPSGSILNDSNGTAPDTAPANTVIYPIPYTDLAGAGSNNHTYDIGFAPPALVASIGNKVWYDTDKDGVQATTNEPGIDGVTVELLDAQGVVTGTAQTTSGGGMYLFEGLTPGEYAVRFTLPSGMTWTTPNTTATTDPDADSDAVPDTDPATATTENTTLEANEADLTWDAGVYANALIQLETQVQDPNDPNVWYDADTVPVVYPPGTQAKYRFVITSTGTSPLTNVVLNDITAGVTGCPSDFSVDLTSVGGVLDPTEVVTVEPTACLSPELTGPFTNDAIVSADPALADGQTLEEALDLLDGSIPPVTDEDPALVSISQPASIGNKVWYDVNKDGVQATTGEPGVDGVTVELLDAQGVVTGTAQTTANGGMYLFEGLTPGDYAVRFTLPNGMTWTTPNAGAAPDADTDSDAVPSADQSTATTENTTLTSGENDLTWDAGIYADAAIELETQVQDPNDPNVWYDADTTPVVYPPGTQAKYRFVITNTGNAPLTNVVLNDITAGVEGCPSNFAVDLTSVGGVLDPAESITVEPPACLSPQLTGPFTNDATISADPSVADGRTIEAAYGLPAGSIPPVTDDDPALVNTSQLGSIGDTVWIDADGNGTQNNGENGIPGVTVKLLDGTGNVIRTAVTGTDGTYRFDDLPAGEYSVMVDDSTLPDGLSQTYDDDGLGTPHMSTITLGAGEVNLDQDFGYRTSAATIQLDKTVYAGHNSGAGCPGGELVTGIQGDDVTYCFVVTNTGNTYLDTITLDDPDLSIARGQMTQLSGTEPLAPNATLVFYYEATLSGNLVNTATTSGNPTDETGRDIPNLPNPTDNDDAEVKQSGPGIRLDKTVYVGQNNGAGCAGTELAVGTIGTEVTYCFEVTNTGDTYLADVVLDSADLGITRADMTLLSGSEPLAPGATMVFYYETTITGDAICTATTSGNPVNEDGSDIPGASDPTDSDPAETAVLASIGDFVWLDTNANGVQDKGEAGIAGVTVTLYNADGGVVSMIETGTDGSYLFDKLTPGDYSLGFDLPSGGYFVSPQGAGGDTNFDSDVDPTTRRTVVTTLDPNEDDMSWDMGVYAPPALAIQKTAAVIEVQAEGIISYSIVISNTGLGDAPSVVVREQVPVNTTFLPDLSTPGWECEGGSRASGTVCTFAVSMLEAGKQGTSPLIFVVQTDKGVSPEIVATIDNVASVSYDNSRGFVESPSDDAIVRVLPPTSLKPVPEPGEGGSQKIFLPLIN